MYSLRVGMAGWDIPHASNAFFPGDGRDLERYAARFDVVEVNSTFYRRPHPKTLDRWRDSTPPGFQFAIKLPHFVTHRGLLAGDEAALGAFAEDAERLGDRLGPLIIQLPTDLPFDPSAEPFFRTLNRFAVSHLVCEPRHDSWFGPDADALMAACRVARAVVANHPHPCARKPGGWSKLVYRRLHEPKPSYAAWGEALAQLRAEFASPGVGPETWCIFDNTISGAASANALRTAKAETRSMVREPG